MIRLHLNYISKSLTILSLMILLASCGSRKDLVYFQDEPITDQSLSELDNNYEITYKPNDILTIDVSFSKFFL